jgi:chromosome segregation ATPase
MAEVTNELIYEVLKAMQARLSNIEDAMREHKGQLVALRQEIHAVNTNISNLYETNGTMDSRLSRIERRLEIIDTHVH